MIIPRQTHLSLQSWMLVFAGITLGMILTACSAPLSFTNPFAPAHTGVVAACPPQVLQQAEWVRNNLTRIQLASPRKVVVSKLGMPAHVESFLLADNSAVDVLYYHSPETACRALPANPAAAGLIPMVFRDDRLLGYGQGYYQTIIVPSLKQPLGLPLNRQLPEAYPPTGGSSVGRGEPMR